ncbi:MAG: radical SAM protein [Candidatus Omnitrophota bacterium]
MPSKEEYRLPLVKNSLVFILTSKCNFGCKHCMRDFNSATDLPMDIAEKALASAKKFGYKNVCLTGGEPTLHAHFKELVAMIMKHGYTLSMPTNGYNFKQFIDVFRKLKKNTFLPAFSLESTKKERHDAIRHNGSYDILLENFKICRDLNIPFRIISAISTANFDETLEIALFAKKKGAHSLSITTVLPCPRSEDNKLVLTQQKRKELLFIVQKIPSIVKIPILAAADICASSNIKMCTSLSMNEITIDMNGNLIHCCEMSNYDASQIARGGIITSLKDKTFVQAIKAYSEYTHKYACQRIDDYEFQKDADDLDFNSCFYCVNKLISHA